MVIASFGLAACTSTKPATPPAATATADAAASKKDDDKKKSDFKDYDEVITDEAVSDSGLVNVHMIDDKLFYEVPFTALGEELLLVSRISKTADNIGYGGEKTNTQVVRWERQGKNILLRIVAHENVADPDQPIYEAVRNSNFEPIIASFKIEAFNDDSTAVVFDATSMFTSDVPSIGLQSFRRDSYRVRRVDASRSFIVSAKSYPRNVEVKHVLTYDAANAPSNGSTNSISLELNQSMIALPDNPMKPRHCDRRVGFFSVRMTNFGLDEQRAKQECFVTRWKLVPKDPAAYLRGELVEPVEPIVYYIDPATPEKWRPYLKQGVDDWQAAFEAAGFKNAIYAMDPPTPEEDPEFSPEDVRYSVIRYFASDIQNAYGPHVHDPRTGQILESDIGWYHNVMNLLRNWYFVQTAAINPEAQKTKFRDEIMGELIRFVSAHEVGHTIGLPHNWGSSAAYPVDSLRSKTFTDAMGTAPSIMDYARFNYVAQPGDGVTNLMPGIGIYDKWSVKWGYTWFPEAQTPEQERETLNEWTVERADDPLYFYGRAGLRVDPRSQNEDLGDDAVKASDYGTANLKRILDNLVTWTAEDGKDYNDLQELYGNVAGQWNRYVGHVARNIGGLNETFKTYDQDGPVYVSLPETQQREAMEWITREVFQTPMWLVREDILRRFEGVGAMDRVRQYQVSALNTVLDPQRMARMLETEVMTDGDTYTVVEMMDDARDGVWGELRRAEAVEPFRRNLQRAYVGRLEYLMTANPSAPPAAFRSYGFTNLNIDQSDIRALVRGELETLNTQVSRAATRTSDTMTRLHLRDISARIDDVLDGDD
ncbi:MAG: zinc-dependent metalloprotease [Rhodothermales bacterium]